MLRELLFYKFKTIILLKFKLKKKLFLLYKNRHEFSSRRKSFVKFFNSEDHRLIHKWVHYLDHYHRHFSTYRDQALLLGKEIKVLEIGLYKGGSIEMWQNYFGPQCIIVGIDIDPSTKVFANEKVFVELGDQENETFLKSIIDKYGPFDIIIDDGGHTMNQQITSLNLLWSAVKPGGIYLCEDTHTSYWSEYGGSYHEPNTFMEHSKLWVDKLNSFHSRGTIQEDRTLLGIHFYDSMVFFDKATKPLEAPHDEKHGK